MRERRPNQEDAAQRIDLGPALNRPNPRTELNRLFRSTGDGSFTLRLPIFCCAEDFKYARAAQARIRQSIEAEGPSGV
jgi:hypothetical protein